MCLSNFFISLKLHFCLGHFLWKWRGYETPNFLLLLLHVCQNLNLDYAKKRNQSIILFQIIMTKLCPSHGKVMAMLLPSHGQVMAKSWLSHGQVMASHGKICQSHSCHLKPNLCPSHDLVISKSWQVMAKSRPSHGQVVQVVSNLFIDSSEGCKFFTLKLKTFYLNNP